jgi:hypothetical protein
VQSSAERRVLLIAMLSGIAVAVIAFATPWAEPFRRAIRPQLPTYVVVLAVLSLAAQLVAALVQGLANRGSWRSITISLSLAASALFMALAFLPGGAEHVPRLIPLLGAALFAVTAAALQRRARARPEI